jgi:hypothetical protein
VKKILEYLADGGSFLYEKFGCRISDSKYDGAFGGTGSVTLKNDVVEIRLWLDRDLLMVDMRGLSRRRAESWYSIDIVKELLIGQAQETAVLNDENAVFFRTHFSDILKCFSSAHLASTESKCNELEKRRSERLFD